MRWIALIAIGVWTSLAGTAALAQENPFATAITVNERAITNFEIAQRKRMLEVFRTPGDHDELAVEQLIEDRLRLIAAERAGLNLTTEAIEAGEEEFAGRVELSRAEFLTALQGAGVDAETFRDFVTAGLVWREVVRARFGPRAQVTEDEIDRALALTSRRGGAEALVTELILPANTPAATERSQALVRRIRTEATTEAQFSSFARRFSVSPSRSRGGRLPEPLDLATLPPQLAAILLTLGPGETSDPVSLPNAIALFQVRELRETGRAEPEDLAIEFAQFLIPGGRTESTLAEAQKVINKVDTCDDLYGVALKLPEERLLRDSLPVADIPQDIALELAKLDAGETSTALTKGGNLVVLMLCGRTAALTEGLDRESVRSRLVSQRLESYANGYLAELRADAIIAFK